MSFTREAIKDYLKNTAPECVQGLRLESVEPPEPGTDLFHTAWQVGCTCGATEGQLLCYLDGVDGVPTVSVGPLGFSCPTCGRVVEMLDTEVNGYHNYEMRSEVRDFAPAKPGGIGPRTFFPCPHCGAVKFVVTVAFFYWSAAFDFFLDEPTVPFENYFNEFQAYAKCVKCRTTTAVTRFGDL
jgi:hypothetical protein